MDQETAHAFQVERARREISSSTDLEALRDLALRMLQLLEGQRVWFQQQVAAGWIKPPG